MQKPGLSYEIPGFFIFFYLPGRDSKGITITARFVFRPEQRRAEPDMLVKLDNGALR
jgi:hypothetical protein